MIIPVDADVNKAQKITQKHWNQWQHGREVSFMRGFHFQHHDRNDDGKYAIAKSFHASFVHLRAHHGFCLLVVTDRRWQRAVFSYSPWDGLFWDLQSGSLAIDFLLFEFSLNATEQ